MYACKPRARYFEQIASMLGVSPTECLMVGDDPQLDLPASGTGMRTFYVGQGAPAGTPDRGSLHDFIAALPDLIS
jgi:FMN phosphatase YigB (HAD superfamily)